MALQPGLLFAVVLLTGCGYPGDPLPPALNIPASVRDLQAVQRGPDIVVTYTAPALTTEDLVIRQFGKVDLRVGPLPAQFSMDAWAGGAKGIQVDTPEPGKPATVRFPASEWVGREVLVALRLAGPKGRESAWSNNVTLTIIPPLRTPSVTARTDPAGVRLTWAAQKGAQYRISRTTENDSSPPVVNTATRNEYVDQAAAFGKTYTYTVQAISGKTESEPSAPVRIVPRDEFPPKPPANVSAVAGISSIELAWERNTEPDLASYRIYRAVGSGVFSVLVDAVDGTAFSDRQTTPGTAYKYRITAVDRSGNESAPSATVEATAP